MGPNPTEPAINTGSYTTLANKIHQKEENSYMPMKLPTTLRHIQSLTNLVNKSVLLKFHEYLNEVDTSENYQNQMLKELVSYAEFLD